VTDGGIIHSSCAQSTEAQYGKPEHGKAQCGMCELTDGREAWCFLNYGGIYILLTPGVFFRRMINLRIRRVTLASASIPTSDLKHLTVLECLKFNYKLYADKYAVTLQMSLGILCFSTPLTRCTMKIRSWNCWWSRNRSGWTTRDVIPAPFRTTRKIDLEYELLITFEVRKGH